MGRSTSSVTVPTSSRWPNSPRRTMAWSSTVAASEPRSQKDLVHLVAGRPLSFPSPPRRGEGEGGRPAVYPFFLLPFANYHETFSRIYPSSRPDDSRRLSS